MKQLVSILIPAFNSERWIRAAVESALSQTWERKEIIIIDDGSRDATLSIARSYERKNVCVVSQENSGASAARNHALSLAQGDYIQWLDADDLLAPDKIARQMEGAEPGHSSQVLLSSAWGQFYHCPEKSCFHPTLLWEDQLPVEWLFRKVDQNLWMAVESWLISRRLIEMAGPWNEKLQRDTDGEYFLRVIRSAVNVRFVPDARSFCRTGLAGSISSDLNLSRGKKESLLRTIRSHTRTLLEMEDSPRTRAACLKMLQRWTVYLYPDEREHFRELQHIAAQLGGSLGVPVLRGKYQLLGKVAGFRTARKAQTVLPFCRIWMATHWERLQCFCLGHTRSGSGAENRWGHV
jgi:glycosyltransferase involved in cell wall biosynthesis